MSVRTGLHHVTRYQYDRPVNLGPQVIRLCPAPHGRTRVSSYSLKVTPAQHFVNWQYDPNGNRIARFVFPEKTTEFSITVDLVADMEVVNPFDFFIEPCAETFPFAYPRRVARRSWRLIWSRSWPRKQLKAFLAGISLKPRKTIDFLVELNQHLQQKIKYVIRMEHGVQSVEETLERSQGSCRDTAWLLVQILRHLGLAARFVSGYLIQLKPDIKPLDGPGRRRARLHRPACLDRGLSAGRRLGRLRSDLRVCCAAKAICRWRRPRITLRRPRSAAWSVPPRSRSRSR